MKKSFMFFITCILLIACSLAQNAPEDFACSFDNGGLTIETYKGREKHVVIPSQIAGYPVCNIADWAFTGKSVLSVVIPGTVVAVADKSFYGCSKLEVIEFLGVLPVDERPFKGLSTTTPPIVRHWDSNVKEEETPTYRGLDLVSAWQAPLPVPVRTNGGKGHLFVDSLTLSFPKMAPGQILRYNEHFMEPTNDSPFIANGAQKTVYQDCHLGLRVFAEDGTPLSGITYVTYGCLDNPKALTVKDFNLRLCTCQNDSGRLEIEGIRTFAPIIRLPKELDGKPVFNLCTPNAWLGRTLAVFLPDDLGQCGYSFANNRFVEYIHFSNGIERLTSGIASNCPSLTDIVLPDSLTVIGEEAFANCASLAEILLPQGLLNIGKRAFANCQALRSIVFPSLLQEMEAESFAGCDNLTEVIFCGRPPQTTGKIFPESVTVIKVQPNLGWPDTFDGIPVEVQEASLRILRTDNVASDFFAEALEIRFEVTQPFVPLEYSLNGAPSIAYTKPFKITEDTMVTVQAVVNGAKYGPAVSRHFVKTDDDGMKDSFVEDQENGTWILRKYRASLAIPQSMGSVDGLSASGNILQSLYIPAATTQLAGCLPMSGPDAVNPLAGLQMLREISVNQDNTAFKVIDGVLFDAAAKTLLAYPPARQGHVYEVPDGVQYIAAEAFANVNSLEAVILPDSVVSIGKGAFRNMASLVEMDFPQKVGKIPVNACLDCVSLKDVFLPDMLESIERGAFMGCVNLREINLPPFLRVIGDDAFRNCRQLEYLDIPASIELVCISALFGVHEDCHVNFNGIYGGNNYPYSSYDLPFWGNGALRDDETDEYLLPHLVVSWWDTTYSGYSSDAYAPMWQCFEEDEDAYDELITSDCNNGHIEYYQTGGYGYSDFRLGYQISMMEEEDSLEDGLYMLDFNFYCWGNGVYDNTVLCYTVDGTEPSLFSDTSMFEEVSDSVTIIAEGRPLIFRARFYDINTWEQIQGEINCLIQEAPEAENFHAYELDYECLSIIEILNQKYISRGSLRNTVEDGDVMSYYTYEPMKGNLINGISQGKQDICLHLSPYQDVVDVDRMIRNNEKQVKVELLWRIASDASPKTIILSEALCKADVDWSYDGDIVDASLRISNPIAGEYKLANGNGEQGDFRVEDGVLFAGDMLVAYPGGKSGEGYDIPEGTRSIARWAFSRNEFGNEPLRYVTIPASLECIYKYAFGEANHIVDIFFKGKKPMVTELFVYGSTRYDEEAGYYQWCELFPNEAGETCIIHAFPNSGFEEEYDKWQDELQDRYYWWLSYWWQEYETFEDYLAEYPCLFWDMGDLVIDGVSAPRFVVQDDGSLAIFMPEDEQFLETRGQYEIHYTTDGTQPTPESPLYEEPIPRPNETCAIKAVVFEDGMPCSVAATYRVRKKRDDEVPICDDPWVLQKDMFTENNQPVLCPPGHGAFIYRHRETVRNDERYMATFYWKLDSKQARMSLKIDDKLVVSRHGYTPWERISVYMEDDAEHRFDWECNYQDDAMEGDVPPDMWLGRLEIAPIPGVHIVTIQDDTVYGVYETGSLVYLLPNLYPDRKVLKWEILSHNAELKNGNTFILSDSDVTVMPYYSQYTENVIRPGWNLLGNIWLFEDGTRTVASEVFVLDEASNSYVSKKLMDVSEGCEAFWYYYDGRRRMVPEFAGSSKALPPPTKGWHLVPGGMELPEGGSCFIFDPQRKVFRHQEKCDDPSAGYWIYIP